jgi:hypothetical protein
MDPVSINIVSHAVSNLRDSPIRLYPYIVMNIMRIDIFDVIRLTSELPHIIFRNAVWVARIMNQYSRRTHKICMKIFRFWGRYT